MTLHMQFTTMLTMIAGGIYLGMVRDTYLYFARHWVNQSWLNYVMEILFWLSQTLILYTLLFLVNFGELRLYIFLACLLGFATYQALIASFYKRVLAKIIRLVVTVFQFIGSLIEWSIIKPIMFLLSLCLAVIGMVLRIVTFLLRPFLKILFAPVKWLIKHIYSLLPKRITQYLHKKAGFYSKIEYIYIKVRDFIVKRRK
ncbi:MAG TPA: spore cortex biosynthesis protein YabQ [Cerasibacillus sp.]|uniref:spore cortex biosynthesis protein YabQ n=1 Tax=Cerasibacillus sp. TaxID=2498711 RepID=UPI002F425EA5